MKCIKSIVLLFTFLLSIPFNAFSWDVENLASSPTIYDISSPYQIQDGNYAEFFYDNAVYGENHPVVSFNSHVNFINPFLLDTNQL